MSNQTADEMKEDYIRLMGLPLGHDFHELMQDAARLHLKWNEFKALYGAGRETIALLNKTATGFFFLTQHAWWHDIILHIFRMTDYDRRVLSILKLSVPPELAGQFKAKVNALKVATKFAHKLRNEYIAHRNREVALQVRPVPDSSVQQVETAIAAIDEALNLVDHHFTKRAPTFYAHLDIIGGSNALIWLLRRGLKAAEEDFRGH